VRGAERVRIPVDVVGARRSGRACAAATTIAVQSGARPMRATSRADPPVRFDLSRVHGPSTGGVSFSIRATAGVRTVSIPGRASSARYYVTDDMPNVAVPPVAFGDVQSGAAALYLPW